MTRKQKLLLRASEIRSELATLADADKLDDTQKTKITELRGEYAETELKIQASSIGEDEPETRTEDTSDRELRSIVERAELGGIFDATLEHRVTSGAEAELQAHLGLTPNQVPIALIRGDIEHRAVTPAPTNVGQNQAEITPAVFPQACAAFLGIDMPTVATGESVYPVLSTSATVHTPAENAAANETTGAFTAEVLSPSRLQASFFYSREDRARFRGMSESLRMNLSDALSDSLDKQIIAGTNGLLTGTNLANHAASAVTTFANYRSDFAYGRVDGTWASSVGELRVVMGSGTYGHAATAYRSNNADDAALDVLMARTGGVKVSAHVPAVASNKQNAVIRLGMRRDMVAPLWEGISLIPDEITKAGSGQIVITAVMLYAVKILRAAGFYKQESQHA